MEPCVSPDLVTAIQEAEWKSFMTGSGVLCVAEASAGISMMLMSFADNWDSHVSIQYTTFCTV